MELRLIGEGNLKNNLEGLAASYNVEVNFLGKVSHHCLPEYLRNADIFVLPSLNEGMSNAILEAICDSHYHNRHRREQGAGQRQRVYREKADIMSLSK